MSSSWKPGWGGSWGFAWMRPGSDSRSDATARGWQRSPNPRVAHSGTPKKTQVLKGRSACHTKVLERPCLPRGSSRIALWIMSFGVVLVVLGWAYALYEFRSTPEPTWQIQYQQAFAQAKTKHRFLMIFFHDDANADSLKFQKEVLTGPKFNYFASEKVVLLDGDLSARVSASIREQNLELMRKFGVVGVPSVVFVNGQEQPGGVIEGYGVVPGHYDWMEVLNAFKCNPGCCQVSNRFSAGPVAQPDHGIGETQAAPSR